MIGRMKHVYGICDLECCCVHISAHWHQRPEVQRGGRLLHFCKKPVVSDIKNGIRIGGFRCETEYPY